MVLVPGGFGGGAGGFGCCGGGFCGNASSGASLAKAQTKAALLRLKASEKIAADKAAVAAAAQSAATVLVSNMETVQPLPVTSEIAIQPVVAQPAPAEPILQSSPFHCDHSCPIIPLAPVIKVCSAEILCATVLVTPVATMKTAPTLAPALDMSTPIIPVLLLGGLVFWLVFRG